MKRSSFLLLVLSSIVASGCLASAVADNVQKGVSESNRHEEQMKSLDNQKAANEKGDAGASR